MPDDDRSLLQLAQQGDATACTALYDRYYEAVYRYCYYHVGDVDLAQDVTSDVFCRMVENLGNLRLDDRPLLAWLYTVARNRTADVHRRKGQRAELALDEVLVDSSLQTDGDLTGGLAADTLAAGLAELTDEQRQVILLRFIQDMDIAETAQLMKKTEGSIKALQHRALAALRRVLEDRGEA